MVCAWIDSYFYSGLCLFVFHSCLFVHICLFYVCLFVSHVWLLFHVCLVYFTHCFCHWNVFLFPRLHSYKKKIHVCLNFIHSFMFVSFLKKPEAGCKFNVFFNPLLLHQSKNCFGSGKRCLSQVKPVQPIVWFAMFVCFYSCLFILFHSCLFSEIPWSLTPLFACL